MKTQAAQFYIPKPIYLQMKMFAAEDQKSLATWGRDLIAEEVKRRAGKMAKSWDSFPCYSWPDEDPNLSEKIDEVLYGDS